LPDATVGYRKKVLFPGTWSNQKFLLPSAESGLLFRASLFRVQAGAEYMFAVGYRMIAGSDDEWIGLSHGFGILVIVSQ